MVIINRALDDFARFLKTNQRVAVSQNGLGLLYRTSPGLSIVSERTYGLKIRLMLHVLTAAAAVTTIYLSLSSLSMPSLIFPMSSALE